MYKAIVFDLDGTLIDSPLCFTSIRRQLDIPEGEDILFHLEKLQPVLRAEKLSTLQEIEVSAAERAFAFPGVVDLLSELHEREIKTGILTRNCRAASFRVIKSLSLSIDMTVTREDAPAKPNPAGLKKLMNHWEVGGHEMLFVGDFRFDIECGKNAGVSTALFTNGTSPREVFEPRPDVVISDYRQFWQSIAR
jgi:HAD superfamily hydrolase (TIGR01549 family)